MLWGTFKNADLPSQIQLQCSKMNLRSLKFEIHCSKRCPLFKFPCLFPKYYIFMVLSEIYDYLKFLLPVLYTIHSFPDLVSQLK